MSYLAIIFITLVFSAFFSGMEIAFLSSNKLRIELEKKKGRYPSGIIAFFAQNPGQYIVTMLVGNNIALVIYGLVMAAILDPVIEKYFSSDIVVLTIQTVISTLIIVITAEFIPKAVFRISPNFFLDIFAIPLIFFYTLFYPVTKFTVWAANHLLKLFFKVEVHKKQENFVFGKVDLGHLVSESQHSQKENEEIEHDIRIFQNALDFSNVKLRECVVPRTELVTMNLNDSIEALKQKFIETGYSKILIYKDSIDDIVGYVHSSGLFKKPQNIRSMMMNILIVPETMPANKLLASFISENRSVAVVVDEFGGTAGIVTIEDIIEEIFGEIVDEHDVPEHEEKQINELEFIFSGRLEVDYLNEKYNLKIPESNDYETIAGFILFHHENIPKLNEMIPILNFNFKILKASNTKIELVHLKLIGKD